MDFVWGHASAIIVYWWQSMLPFKFKIIRLLGSLDMAFNQVVVLEMVQAELGFASQTLDARCVCGDLIICTRYLVKR